MKLYLLLISIFLVKVIGLFYYLSLIFIYNFSNHIRSRMSFYKDKYDEYLIYKIIDKGLSLQKVISTNINNFETYDNIYYKIITNNNIIPIINFYNNIEQFYFLVLDEIFLMFYTLAFSLFNSIITSSIKKKSNIKEIQINKLSNSSLVDSDSDSLSDEINFKNTSSSNNFTDDSLINRLKKKNNIEGANNKIDLNDTISSVSILLNKLNKEVDNFKDKDL